MANHLECTSGGAGPTANGVWCVNQANGFDVTIKNVGDVTVYIGSVNPEGETGVSPYSGFPLLPGERITVPNPVSSAHRVGFNTDSGTANLRIMQVVAD